ncbi:MAG: HAD family phosphatase [Bacteroidetes bacterium]|nr:HAD family phosphatase [Bacteroidota bacterium]
MAVTPDKLTRIKNIVFDFGGVIINIDHHKVENAFKELGIHDFDRLFSQASQSELFQKLEVGLISEQEFRDDIRKLTGLKINDDRLDNTWNQIIGDYPPHRIEVLKQIKNNYKLFLLSNTNSIHFRHYISKFQYEFGFPFISLFDHTYWSFKIGKRKPDPDPYQFLLDQEKLNAEETLFIDDSIQNILAAQKLNILALHLDDHMDLGSLFIEGKLNYMVVNDLVE